LTETLTESFCERCGTRYEFKAPTRLNPLRKTRGLFGGLKNYLTSQDALSDSIGDAMRDEEGALATAQLEAFHEAFNFCIDCRQYTCVACWNDAAGRCRSCVPVAGVDDLTERLAASTAATPVAGMAEAPMASNVPPVAPDAWPTSDLPLEPAATNGSAADDAWATTPGTYAAQPVAQAGSVAPTGGFVGADGFVYDTQERADAVAAQLEAEAAALAAIAQAEAEAAAVAEADAVAAEQAEFEAAAVAEAEADAQAQAAALAEADALAAEQAEAEAAAVAEADALAAAQAEAEVAALAAEAEAAPVAAEAESEPVMVELEPGPVIAEVEPEPPRLRVVAWDDDTTFELEPEPVAASAEPAPEAEPEPVAATVETDATPTWADKEPIAATVEPEAAPVMDPPAEPEPIAASVETEPEPVTPATIAPRIAPISETILHFPQRPVAEPVAPAAMDDTPEVAARRAQLDELGLGDPGEGPMSDRPAVLPYRSRGAAMGAGEMAILAAAGQRFWEASAREVAGAVGNVGVQNCGQCGLSLSANARFCRRCGTRQAQPA
jgi:hypothetical protein